MHEPRLLLLDEPLSNLDAQLRDEMRGELKRLQSKIGITTVYVTHDQSEALALSDQIAVIDQGRITQIGSPQDIYFRPANPFVARFVGATNLLAGRLIGAANGRGEVEVLGGRQIQCLVPQDDRRSGRRSRSRSGRKASAWCRAPAARRRPARTVSPAASAASRSWAPPAASMS